ncbi:MAG TPA: hypothetical protein VFY82_06520 [Acidimicrobiales bacterium]|nr:hypothetical protein [Acidimicrobiales bacterium]
MIGIALGTLVAGYVAVVGMTFAGVPLVGRLAPPGVEELARPAADQGVSVSPGAQQSPLPTDGTGERSPDGVEPALGDAAGQATADGGTGATPTSSTSTTVVTTTTTAPPGNGATTSVPAPNGTVPDRTHTTGPPAEPPGKP